MMPVLGPQELRAADAWTIAHEPIAPLALMERAARACTERLLERREAGALGTGLPVLVVAGMGNNGGDGLAMARMLAGAGVPVEAVRIRHRDAATGDNEANRRRAVEAGVAVHEAARAEDLPAIGNRLVVDALFGTGLDRPLDGLARKAVAWMNASGAPIVSIDMPSGLFAESNEGNGPAGVVRARCTLTLEVPKLSLLLPDLGEAAGRWEVVPIGLDAAYVSGLPAPYRLVERADAAARVPARPRFSHKGAFGHALLLGGSPGKMGAMALAARAALHSGAGLVTCGVPDEGVPVLQAVAPEAMCAAGLGRTALASLPELAPYQAIGIGPGLGTGSEAAAAVRAVLEQAQAPLVIDADALNLLAAERALLKRLPPGCILTPHPKEFERLAGRRFGSGFARLQAARSAAREWRCTLLLKGAFSAICAPDGSVRFNPTGNPGMAKGGSGDALTGLLAGLLAQGVAPADACLLGAWIHGRAGDRAAARWGMQGMTAMHLAEALPEAWQDLPPGRA